MKKTQPRSAGRRLPDWWIGEGGKLKNKKFKKKFFFNFKMFFSFKNYKNATLRNVAFSGPGNSRGRDPWKYFVHGVVTVISRYLDITVTNS
jgi:hypothetical protein